MLQNPPTHSGEGSGVGCCGNKIDVCRLAVGTQRDLPIPPAGCADQEMPFVEGAAGNTTPQHHRTPFRAIRGLRSSSSVGSQIDLPELGRPVIRDANWVVPCPRSAGTPRFRTKSSPLCSGACAFRIAGARLNIVALLYPCIMDSTNYINPASVQPAFHRFQRPLWQLGDTM
jgi:hypothetical protein